MKLALLLYIGFAALVLGILGGIKFSGVEEDVAKLCKDIIDTASYTGTSFRLVCNVGDGYVEFGGKRATARTTYAAVSSYGWGNP